LVRAYVDETPDFGVKVRDEPNGALRIVRIGGVVQRPTYPKRPDHKPTRPRAAGGQWERRDVQIPGARARDFRL